MLEQLIKINDNIIAETSNEEKKKKHILIKKILEDNQCFLKMNIETSYALLRELNVPDEKLKNVFSILIEPSKND